MATKELKVRLTFDANTAGLKKSKTAMESLTDSVQIAEQNMNLWLKGALALAPALAGLTLKNLIDESTQAAVEQKAFAQQLSVSVEMLSKYEYIASKAHVSTDQLRDAFKDAGTKVTEFQRDGESAKEAFKVLGISQDFAKKQMYTTERSMDVLLQRLAKFPDGMQKATIAQEIFGDEGANIIRITNLGTEAIRKYTDEAMRGNIITSEAYAQKSAMYADASSRLSALEGGWASAVIEESQFLESTTSIYTQLGDVVMDWTADVQSGNSVFVEGLETILTNTELVFPEVIEMSGMVGSSMYSMGESVFSVGGSIVELIGKMIGFDDEANTNITTLGHFTGLAMGATMAIENFGQLMKFSANGIEIFGVAIESYAISRLNYLQGRFYASMGTVKEWLNILSFGELGTDYAEYNKKAINSDLSMIEAINEGNSKISVLMNEREEILKNVHDLDWIEANMEFVAEDVSERQLDRLAELDKHIQKTKNSYDEQGKASVKALEKSMKALKKAEDDKKNAESSAKEHAKAVEAEARAYEKLQRELEQFDDVYRRSTMSESDYKSFNLDIEKEKYIEIGADRLKIDEWYAVESAKIEQKALDEKIGKYREFYKEHLSSIEKEVNAKDEAFEREKEQLEEIASLQKELIGTLVEDILHGSSLADSYSNIVEMMKDDSIFKFSKTLSEQVVEGFEQGFENIDYGELGTGLATSLGYMAQSYIVANNQDSSRQRDGTAVGGAIGTAVGTYYGGTVGGAIGGAVGSGLGGVIAGGERDYYIRSQNGELYSMRYTSGGWFHSDKVEVLESETKALVYNFELLIDSYQDLLEDLNGSTVEFTFENRNYSVGELTQNLRNDFFSSVVGIDTDYRDEIEQLQSDIDDWYESDKKRMINQANSSMLPQMPLSDAMRDELDRQEAEYYSEIEYMESRLYMLQAHMADANISDALLDKSDNLVLAWEQEALRLVDDKEKAVQIFNEALVGVESNIVSVNQYLLQDSQELYSYMQGLLQTKQDDLEATLGVANISIETYESLFEKAKENGDLMPEQIRAWESLGQVLLQTAKNADEGREALQGLEDSYSSNFFTAEQNSLRDIETLRGKFMELGYTMPQTSAEFVNLVESSGSARTALLELNEEFHNTVGAVEQTIEGLRDSQSRYTSAKVYTESGIYADIENYSTVGNSEIEAGITSWYNAQKSALEETASYQITIDNSHNKALNEQIKLTNALHDSILKMQQEAKMTLTKSIINESVRAKSYLGESIANNDWTGVQNAYSAIVTSAQNSSSSRSEELLKIAFANQQIQSVEAPEKRDLLDTSVRTETHTRDISADMKLLDEKAFQMYEALIAENENSLVGIETNETFLVGVGESVDRVEATISIQEKQTRDMLDMNFQASYALSNFAISKNISQDNELKKLREKFDNLEKAMKKMVEAQEIANSLAKQQTEATIEMKDNDNLRLHIEKRALA